MRQDLIVHDDRALAEDLDGMHAARGRASS